MVCFPECSEGSDIRLLFYNVDTFEAPKAMMCLVLPWRHFLSFSILFISARLESAGYIYHVPVCVLSIIFHGGRCSLFMFLLFVAVKLESSTIWSISASLIHKLQGTPVYSNETDHPKPDPTGRCRIGEAQSRKLIEGIQALANVYLITLCHLIISSTSKFRTP